MYQNAGMKRTRLFLVIANTVTLLIMLFANYAANAGLFSGKNVADVSHKYDTLIAPSGYAFIIWGMLFLLAIGYVICQWMLLRHGDPHNYIERTWLWFSISNIANAAWLYCWLNERLGLSVICILLLLMSLVILTVHLRIELDDVAVRYIFFVWWPITFYLGWIMVATIACIAAWLTSIEWDGFGLTQNFWTIVLMIIANVVYLVLIIRRNMREAAVVGIWAFIAIAVRQWNSYNSIVYASLIASTVLLIASLLHVYKNRKYNVPAKLRRGEW
jgi:hypothetical protein